MQGHLSKKILFRSECFIDYVVQHGIEVYLSLIPFADRSTLAMTRHFNAFFISVLKLRYDDEHE